VLKSSRQASHGHLTHNFLGLIRTADNFLEGGDKLLLVVDQTPQRRQLRGAREFAEVPRVLGEEIIRTFFSRADKIRSVRGSSPVETALVEATRAEFYLARIDQRADLEQNAVSVL